MDYDPDLVERLAALITTPFAGEVFRATRATADPIAPSVYGGRWAWPQDGDPGVSALYTSLDRDGAIAEIASSLAEQTPIPGRRELKVTRLAISTSKTIRLAHGDLNTLGVDISHYGERDYERTQEIGSTLAWLGLDGLIAPSARWQCNNLIIFTDNHQLTERLDPIDYEMIEWRAWAEAHGLLKADR